jgi:hypothetical protein
MIVALLYRSREPEIRDAEMTIPNILAATWSDGVFVFTGEARRQELAGQVVNALAPDQNGGALAIVDGHSLCRRTGEGVWTTFATSQLDLACVVVAGDVIYLGTDDARVLRISENGEIDALGGFEAVPGRDTWYAGSAVINGQVVGPPLGVRSMAATSDGAVLLVNVHVGGIPRSTDGGLTWQPTIDIANDVHEVCAHPAHPGLVIAAAATGLCISRDGGASWTVVQQGLHASYCSAVAFSKGDILVAAATDHFAGQGAVYRRSIYGNDPLEPVGALPRWLEGIADTGCISTRGSALAVADKAGNLYVSSDGGDSWLRRDSGLPTISSVLLV